MLKVELHNNLQNPQQLDATRVVVYDTNDNPVAFVVQSAEDPRICMAATCDHKDFNRMLSVLGIKQTVLVQDANQVPIESIKFE